MIIMKISKIKIKIIIIVMKRVILLMILIIRERGLLTIFDFVNNVKSFSLLSCSVKCKQPIGNENNNNNSKTLHFCTLDKY